MKQKLFSKAVFFQKTLHLFSRSFFQRLFVFIACLSFFAKTLHLFSRSFFQSLFVFFACLSFFSKTLHLFSRSFFQRLYSPSFQQSVFFSKTFFSPVCFFQRCFFAKDRQSNTGRTTRKVLVGQPVLLSLSIAKVYFWRPFVVFLVSKTSFFPKGLLK